MHNNPNYEDYASNEDSDYRGEEEYDKKNEDSEEKHYGEIVVKWKNPPKLSDIKAELIKTYAHHNFYTSKIDNWLDSLYPKSKFQKNCNKQSVKQRSRIEPKLIRKQAEWRYSALTEPFLGNSRIFDILPSTWEDTNAAKQNELLLNHQFNNVINKHNFIDEYVRCAVNEGTVFIRVGWEYQEEKYTEEVPKINWVYDETLGESLTNLANLKKENPNQYLTTISYEIKQAVSLFEEQGLPYRPDIVGTEEVEKTRILSNCPTLEVCEYDNIYIDPTCKGNLDEANFIIHSFSASKSDLMKDGKYSNLDELDIENNSPVNTENYTNDSEQGDFNFKDNSRKKFVVHEYWGFYPIEGGSVNKPIIVSWVGDTLIRMDLNPYPDKKLPFIAVSYTPTKHSVYGEPDGELLEDNQKIIGAVTRGVIDVLGKSANGQTGMRKDMLDGVNKRRYERGEDYEFNGGIDPRQGVYTHVFPEIPNSAQYVLNYQNAEAESLTGVKSFSGGLSGDSLGETATGVRGVLDAASKRELGILRRLADGMVQVGKKIVAMNGVFLSATEVVRITNDEFVPIRKDELAGKFDLKITITTSEEDNAKAEELAFIMQTSANTLDFGITKFILADIANLRKMPDLAKKIEEYNPEPDPLEVKQKELEIAKIEAQIQKLNSEALENNLQAELIKVRIEDVSADTDKKSLDFVEQESGVTQERDLQKQGEQARGNLALKKYEHDLKEQSRLSEKRNRVK